MTNNLLSTKFYIPAQRPNLVSRPRLLDQLDEGFQYGRKLTLVSAPAGYGKTTLIVEWVGTLSNKGESITWLTLDEGDNDPLRFWSYFISALRAIPALQQKGIGEAAMAELQTSQQVQIEDILIILINEIMEVPQRSLLVLDDLHLVTEADIHTGLTYLVEHLPSTTHGLHLAITTRRDPPWPMARLRSHGELTEVRVHDLRFTTNEAAQFLEQAIGIELSAVDINALDKRIEGWIAGLQMAALSMNERQDPSSFITSFSGSHRFILDYLVEEVLERQTPEIQEFLLKTSILERLTAPLCDTLASRNDSQSILSRVERDNLFLSPLDDERRWYRYHSLFADLLRRRLARIKPDELHSLHQCASMWFEENGWLAEAISHAYVAGDVERVARLIEANAFNLLDLGEMATMLRWIKKIPGDVRQARPWLEIAQAWIQVYAGQLVATEDTLQQAQDAISRMDKAEQESALGHINAIRAYAAWIRSDGESAVQYASQALEQLPTGERTVRALAKTTLAQGLLQCNNFGDAIQVGKEAVGQGRSSGSMHVYMLAVGGYAYLLILQGSMHEAEAVCREALAHTDERAEQPGGQSPAAAQVYAMLSYVLREWNEQDQAVAVAQKGLELSKRWAQADTLTLNYISLGGALMAAGELERAAEALEGAKRVAAHVSGWFEDIVERQEAELNLATGNLESAALWAEERIASQGAAPQPSQSPDRMLVKVLLAQGKLDEASQLLERLAEAAEISRTTGVLVSVLPLQAVALAKQGKHEQATKVLDRALVLAEPERIIRPFLTAGEALVPLLHKSASQRAAPLFAREVLVVLETNGDESAPTLPRGRDVRRTKPLHAQMRYIEPLTKREFDVLRLLNTHLSVPDIAQEMYVAPSTVRSHIRSIYRKLDVHGRYEAVHRAKELDLI